MSFTNIVYRLYTQILNYCVCVCVCVRACVRACVHACVRVCATAHTRVFMYICT